MMRALFASLAVALCLGCTACGEGSAGAGSAPRGHDDSDDSEILHYGHAASPTDAGRIVALVKRYYAAAAAENGAGACALTYFILLETLPEDYGGPPGPLYLRGARTCQAVLSRVFAHFHARLSRPMAVTGVRVNGDLAYALLGSTTTAVGYMAVRREHGVWKIDRALAAPLP
jgi:hypothetical protein